MRLRHRICTFATIIALSFIPIAQAGNWSQAVPAAGKSATTGHKRIVIPFDFESKFDNGEYGQNIGEMIWTKLHREGGFILPESMQDVRDWCQRARMIPGPDTPLIRMKDIVAKKQAGEIGIWGKVERVAGFETDVYDLWITVADFSVDPPRMIYQKKARTRTVSEIPHVYVKEAIDSLYGRSDRVSTAPDRTLLEQWNKAPNLVHGDFEQGRQAPLGWSPLHADVTWVQETVKGGKSKNRVIRFTLNEEVAGTSGVLYYSDPFPVEEGATYRFQCRWKSTGSAAKVFIKCYDELPTEFPAGSVAGRSTTEGREVYRSQQNLEGSPGVWNMQTEDFTPLHGRFTQRWGRVMLYAYWPAGTVEWDDIIVKRIAPAPAPAPAGKAEKDRRPSSKTKARSKETPKQAARC
jgi:hypothetical protein